MMLDKKELDKELVKALRACAKGCVCSECPYDEEACPSSDDMFEHAADTIERLTKEKDELISRFPKWISVKEKLPEESGGYLAYIHEPHMIQKADWEEQYDFSYVMQLWFDKQKMLWSDGHEDSYNAYLPVVDTDNAFHVTHWMKLPEPPKGE